MYLPVYAELRRIAIESPQPQSHEHADTSPAAMAVNTAFSRRGLERAARDAKHDLGAWTYDDAGIISASCSRCDAALTLFYRGTAIPWIPRDIGACCAATDTAPRLSVG